MEATESFEKFPVRIVLVSNLVAALIYIMGLFIMYSAGIIFSLFFLGFILAFEYRLLATHCVNCYYWGKVCGFGKGKVSSRFFKKGDSSKFCAREMTWKDLIPDILLSVIPLITGIVLLILDFDIMILFSMLILIFLGTAGNGYVRGTLVCKYCKQKEAGCPADTLFSKKRMD